jgi:hypothetical protein
MIQKIDGEYRVISQKVSSKDGWAYQGRNLIVEMINGTLHVYVQWLPSWEPWVVYRLAVDQRIQFSKHRETR